MHQEAGVVLVVWLSVVTGFDYDEKLAREKFLPLASAAYSRKPEDCVNNVFSDATVSYSNEHLSIF